jgi:hypothetical protein
MGYIGLLLNAPYKIDSMMGMSLMMIVTMLFGFFFRVFLFCGLCKPERPFWDVDLKMGVIKVLGV